MLGFLIASENAVCRDGQASSWPQRLAKQLVFCQNGLSLAPCTVKKSWSESRDERDNYINPRGENDIA